MGLLISTKTKLPSMSQTASETFLHHHSISGGC